MDDLPDRIDPSNEIGITKPKAQEITLPVFPPHGPVHDETEFWYDLKEKALLYEVNIIEGYLRVEADHDRARDRGHIRGDDRVFHHHYQPHGIYLLNRVIGESRRKASLSNIELLVRLWLQIEQNEQPRTSPHDEHPVLPVNKTLALFLAGKQAEMYMEESFTQALSLLQAYLTAKAIPQWPSPTS